MSASGKVTICSGPSALRAENARLIALLEAHGVAWRAPSASPDLASETSRFSTAQKLTLFRRLFRGRTDVYPVRWESRTTGKSGYAPACANEWRAGVCEKPRIRCSDCGHRQLIPMSESVIYGHLAGAHTVGISPLMEDDTCYFVAADFDEAIGAKMHEPLPGRATNSACRWRWRSPARARARTPGSSSMARCRRAMRVDSARPSSATPVRVPGSCG